MLQLKVEAIKWELPDTATFFFSEISGKKILYKAGQFITLVFNHHDEEIRRSYSLSSLPDEDLLSITVKRITNGETVPGGMNARARFTYEIVCASASLIFVPGWNLSRRRDVP